MAERPLLVDCKRVVIKTGSALLAAGGTGLMSRLAQELYDARQDSRAVTLVSSGAIALGIEVLGLDSRPRRLGELQVEYWHDESEGFAGRKPLPVTINGG